MEEYRFGVGLVFAIFAIVSVTSLGFIIGLYWIGCLLLGVKFSLIIPTVFWLAIFILSIVASIGVYLIGYHISKRW